MILQYLHLTSSNNHINYNQVWIGEVANLKKKERMSYEAGLTQNLRLLIIL